MNFKTHLSFIQGKDKALLVLRGLLQDLGAELRDERIEFDREAKNTQSKAAEVEMMFTLQACFPPLCARLRAATASPADDLFAWPHVLLTVQRPPWKDRSQSI